MAVTRPKGTSGSPAWGLAGAVASAMGASACCVGPLLLLAVGVGGNWVGSLTAMEKYRPVWTAATLVFLGLAFAGTYRTAREQDCPSGGTCPTNVARRNKIRFWIVAALVLGLLALPYLVQRVPYAFPGRSGVAPITRRVTLSVENMTCGACTVTVNTSLARVVGVRDAKVTLDPARAAVVYDPAKVGPDSLIEATTRAGYPSTVLPEGGRQR